MMQLVLCRRSRSIAAALLRFATWSRWSHSAVYDDEAGTVFDATFSGGGVRVHAAADFFKDYKSHELQPIGVLDKSAARAWLDEQLGKGYDWTAIVSFLVRRDWQDEDRWFCSEFSEAFRGKFDRPRFRSSLGRVTPQHQAMVL